MTNFSRSAFTAVASSRWHEQSFEDDGLRRTIFSRALFEILAPEVPEIGKEACDLDTILWPYLRDTVPVLSYQLKGTIQTPVRLQYTSVPILLTVKPMRSKLRTPIEVLRSQWRRAVASTTVTLILILAGVYATTWHLSLTADNRLALYYGPTWLPSLPWVGPAIEFSLDVESVTQAAEKRRQALSRQIGGLWSQRLPNGMLTWVNRFGLHSPPLAAFSPIPGGTIPRRLRRGSFIVGEMLNDDALALWRISLGMKATVSPTSDAEQDADPAWSQIALGSALNNPPENAEEVIRHIKDHVANFAPLNTVCEDHTREIDTKSFDYLLNGLRSQLAQLDFPTKSAQRIDALVPLARSGALPAWSIIEGIARVSPGLFSAPNGRVSLMCHG